MEARFIGPESELGNVSTLNFFGNSLTREWSEVKFSPDALEKARGNKYVEIRGEPKAADLTDEKVLEETRADQTEQANRARLAELGVDVPENSSPAKLQSLLDKAEKANAKAEAEANEAAEQQAADQAS